MTTLTEYTTAHFPNHVIERTPGDLTLTDHTAVAHVVGSENGLELARRLHLELGADDVATVLVRPTEPTIVGEGGEDPEGIVDLPYRRVAAGGLAGAAVVGIAIGVVTGAIFGSFWVGVILGAFAAVVGGVIAAMATGGARAAGHRAWEQPHAPDRTIAVVAAFTDTERDAVAVARLMEQTAPHDVRIVNADGAWHAPNT